MLTCTAGVIGPGRAFFKMLVTGTPGTGKTYWQLHLLWHLARRGETVVLDRKDSKYRYLLTRLYLNIYHDRCILVHHSCLDTALQCTSR